MSYGSSTTYKMDSQRTSLRAAAVLSLASQVSCAVVGLTLGFDYLLAPSPLSSLSCDGGERWPSSTSVEQALVSRCSCYAGHGLPHVMRGCRPASLAPRSHVRAASSGLPQRVHGLGKSCCCCCFLECVPRRPAMRRTVGGSSVPAPAAVMLLRRVNSNGRMISGLYGPEHKSTLLSPWRGASEGIGS